MFAWLAWLRRPKSKPAAVVASATTGTRGKPSQRVTAAGQCGFEGFGPGLAPLPPHPLLSLLPPETLERLIASGAVDEYPKGTVVFRAGTPCDALFLIVSGRCDGRSRNAAGVEVVENIFGPGDLLGARAMLNREAHRSTAEVVTDAILLRIPAADLQDLFITDPAIAGRFSQTVTTVPTEPPDRVRRIVATLTLSHRLESVVDWLASGLLRITGQRVLVARLGPAGASSNGAKPLSALLPAAEFTFLEEIQHRDGFDELHLTARAESKDSAAIAPLLSRCSQHYDYVLLLLEPDTPLPVLLQGLAQCDLAYVLLQAGMQNLHDFRLLVRELESSKLDSAARVKPLLFADESIAEPEAVEFLRKSGYPAHEVIRGFPLRNGPEAPDHRFEHAARRISREIARCRVGLALSSGSAKGLAHIGVLQVFEENGIEVDCVAGSSMGAYIGAVWASGHDGEAMEKAARENEGRWGLMRLMDPVILPRRGFLRTRRVVSRLRRTIGDPLFSDLVHPLRVVSTHLETLERVVFSSGSVVDAVEASIAIPGVCVPVYLDGETYIDGGIADPLPVDVLAEMGYEKIIAVNVVPSPEQLRFWRDAERERHAAAPRPRGLTRFFNSHLNYAASGNILDTLLRAINGAQTRLVQASVREADVVLEPISCDSVWHDFNHPRKFIALGRSVAEAQLSQIKTLIGEPAHEPPQTLAIESCVAA